MKTILTINRSIFLLVIALFLVSCTQDPAHARGRKHKHHRKNNREVVVPAHRDTLVFDPCDAHGC